MKTVGFTCVSTVFLALFLVGCSKSDSDEQGCATGLTHCESSGNCVDLLTDSANCGACGSVCPAGQACDGSGHCVVQCQPGQIVCGGTCIDPKTSNTYCGASDPCDKKPGTTCPAGQVCDGSGQCAVTCQPGQIVCDGTCIDPKTSNKYCGASDSCDENPGTTCPSGQVCDGSGQCAVTCQPGQIVCDGTCIDPNSSNTHCGASESCDENPGKVCEPGQVCNGSGECELSCQQGLNDCDGKCVDNLTDNANCGGCGQVCDPGEVCAGGTCGLTCSADTPHMCHGLCVDARTNASACGVPGVDANPCMDCASVTGLGSLCFNGTCMKYEAATAININASDPTTASPDVTLYLREPGNLLVNGSAEAGNLSGWTILQQGPDGWNTTNTSLLDGPHAFVTDRYWCRRSQEVDLLAAGYTASQLDAQPPIAVREWYRGTPPKPDFYYFRAELRDADHAPIATFDFGSQFKPQTATLEWQVVAHTFASYGDGVRYVYIEDGGMDDENWAGQFGTIMDAATVMIETWEMQLSNSSSSSSPWEPFAYTTPWTLTPGAGPKQVYVWFRNEAKVEHGPFVHEIWLE